MFQWDTVDPRFPGVLSQNSWVIYNTSASFFGCHNLVPPGWWSDDELFPQNFFSCNMGISKLTVKLEYWKMTVCCQFVSSHYTARAKQLLSVDKMQIHGYLLNEKCPSIDKIPMSCSLNRHCKARSCIWPRAHGPDFDLSMLDQFMVHP